MPGARAAHQYLASEVHFRSSILVTQPALERHRKQMGIPVVATRRAKRPPIATKLIGIAVRDQATAAPLPCGCWCAHPIRARTTRAHTIRDVFALPRFALCRVRLRHLSSLNLVANAVGKPVGKERDGYQKDQAHHTVDADQPFGGFGFSD